VKGVSGWAGWRTLYIRRLPTCVILPEEVDKKRMAIIDKRGKLDEVVFTCRITKEKKVFISWHGKQVTVLDGKKAEAFIADIKMRMIRRLN
jgi:hypothetical protein